MVANRQLTVARTRGLLTENDRKVLAGEKGDENRQRNVIWEVENRIRDEVEKDVEVLAKHHPDLLKELREVVCDDLESQTPICPDCMHKVSVSHSKSSDYFCSKCHAELSENDIIFEEDVGTPMQKS